MEERVEPTFVDRELEKYLRQEFGYSGTQLAFFLRDLKILVKRERLKANVKRNANAHELTKDKNDLLLLLGECNYMVRECVRNQQKSKKR